MIEFDPTRCKTKCFQHQVVGTTELLRHPGFALFDEMGAGKSKQVVDAACALYEAGEIGAVIVVCPASVRDVWTHATTGQIAQHAWVASGVWEWHTKSRWTMYHEQPMLLWTVTNYEWLRGHAGPVCEWATLNRVMLVCDESSFIKNGNSDQARAVRKLRSFCKRCVILNGTPATESPLDLWNQLNTVDPAILGKRYKHYVHFRNHICVMGGFRMKQVLEYKHLDELSELIKPYCLRRLKQDCLDLPPKMYQTREVALTKETWSLYQQLKRDFIVQILDNEQAVEPNAAVRLMRLQQLTSGFCQDVNLSTEKLDWAVDYLLNVSTAHATIVWMRFRRDRERLAQLLLKFDTIHVYELFGEQPKHERAEAIAAFGVGGGPRRVLLAQPHAGGLGISLVAAQDVLYFSDEFSLFTRLQSEDRTHRPGQHRPVLYTDLIATGPKGERTIDHVVVQAHRDKEEVERWTTARWRRELEE